MASLLQINEALRDLEVCEGEKPTLEPVIEALHKAQMALNELAVKGRNNIDVLLGCMMCIEQIIGEEDTNG